MFEILNSNIHQYIYINKVSKYLNLYFRKVYNTIVIISYK